MEYQVKHHGEVVSAWSEKEDAITDAQNRNDLWHQDTAVVAHEVSGTYQSWTTVWPESGPTRTN